MKTKQCHRCGETKPISEFYNDRARKDGKMNECIDCHKDVCRKNYHEKKLQSKKYIAKLERDKIVLKRKTDAATKEAIHKLKREQIAERNKQIIDEDKKVKVHERVCKMMINGKKCGNTFKTTRPDLDHYCPRCQAKLEKSSDYNMDYTTGAN